MSHTAVQQLPLRLTHCILQGSSLIQKTNNSEWLQEKIGRDGKRSVGREREEERDVGGDRERGEPEARSVHASQLLENAA